MNMNCEKNNNELTNHLKARLSFNDKILDVLQGVCQKMGDELCEDYEWNPNNLPEDDYILLQCIVFIYERAGYNINFSNNLQLNSFDDLTDNEISLLKQCVDEICERTDDLIEWLQQTDKILYNRLYHQYLEENGYYD